MDRIEEILEEIKECFAATTAALAPFAVLPAGERPATKELEATGEKQDRGGNETHLEDTLQ